MSLTYAQVSRRANELVTARDREWSGVPMPLPGHQLRLESKSPWRERLDRMQAAMDSEANDAAQARRGQASDEGTVEVTVINSWWSKRLQMEVTLVRDEGKVRAYFDRAATPTRFDLLFRTMDVSQAWSLETEITAIEKLETLIKPHLYEAYLLTGTFLETSRRSGITYIFRRGRPTLAFRNQRLLCALCLHPIGYYDRTFAGSMVPTDDVIAHLLLMRGDEPLFWRRANQHPADRPESGL